MASKEINKLLKALEAQGWRVAPIKKGWMAYSPNGVDKATIHGTPSDRRAWQNMMAELRRGGFDG